MPKRKQSPPEALENEPEAPDFVEPQRPSDPKMGMFRTQREVAEFFEVNERTVRQWMADGAPRPPAVWGCGRYDVVEIKNWLETHPTPARPWRYRRPRA